LEGRLRSRIRDPSSVPEVDLTEALLRSEGPARPTPRWWRRLAAWLAAAWASLVAWWVRLVRRVRGRPAAGASRTAGVDAGRLLRERPELLAALRLEAGPGFRARLRKAWERLAGREDYAEALQRLAQREREAARARTQLEVRAENEAVERELARLEREAQKAAQQREERERELEAQQAEARKAEEEALRQGPLRRLGDTLLGDLRSVGLVDASGRATAVLLERFSALLQQEALAAMPGGGQATPGHYAGGEGEYERGPMRSLHELGAIDLAGSVLQARIRHPGVRHVLDDDVLVHRELRQSHAHVVVVLDTSGSMEEDGRLEAAKRVALVLHRIVRQMGPEHRVDMLTMSTSVQRADLAAVWNAQPGGFTNFSAALREARRLLDAQGADRRVVYLVTDGLPEARTLPDGRDVADSPKNCLPEAVQEARQLARGQPARLVIYQLEPHAQVYVEAARKVADAAGGRVEVLDPKQLMASLLVDMQGWTARMDAA
ncbi:MAG TPA: VWA domain-containing protein, partial [Candidatus Thermoplasmatota archaeon]|nr:VWA domain-containing protein [Candidatus Thermoplasmatota archaeon]